MASESWKSRYNAAKSAAAKRDEEWEASRPKPLPTVTRVNKVDVQDERAAQSKARVNTANQRMANLSAKQSGLLPLGSGERMEDVNSELSALRHEQDLVSQYNNDLSYRVKRGLGYGTERAGSALLGAAEGLTDIIGSGFYAGLSGLTSLGGLAPNPVSEWALDQGQAFLDNSVTRDWEESIEKRYKPTEAERKVTGIGQSVAQMLPAIGVSKVVGAAQAAPKAVSAAKGLLTGERVGQALFGLQAAGNAASQAKQEGASLGQSVAYGAASGLTESLIERVSGGIPGLGNGVLDDVAARVASNPIVRNALDILGEGGEEAVSAVLDPYLRRAMYDPDAKNATPQEIAEAAVTGAIAAGVLKGGIELPTAVGDTVSRVKTVRDSVGTNQDIASRVNAGIAEGNGPFRPYEQNRTESKADRVPGEYRAETPQNVEYPTVPIINLSMQNVADMNGGTLPASGNALRKQAISRARKNLGLDETGTIYIPASNVTRNGEEYILKITRSTLNKMLSPSNGGVVQPESLVVLDNIDRIANNGVYFKSEGDRKGRDQIAGYDHLMTTVYIDNQPYTVDMRVRVYDEKTGGGNTLYYFTPEEIITTKKVDADLPTGTLHERTMIQEAAPTSISTIPQNRSYGNQKAGQDIESLKRKTGIEVPITQRTWEDASNRKVNAFQYDHPELRPYYQQAARELQTELLSGTKGERFAITDSDGYVTGYTGTKRSVSEPVAQARDNANLSYEQIQKAIDDLIADHGQENYAAAKKVEMVLDDMLTNGYTDVSGQYVEPNEAYVAARDGVFSAQQDGDSQYRMSEEEWESILSQDYEKEKQEGGIKVYRGFNRSNDPLQKNLAGFRSINDIIGVESPEVELVPLEYYTSKQSDAENYANHDIDLLNLLFESKKREYISKTIDGYSFDDGKNDWAEKEARKAYESLTGRKPPEASGTVEEFFIYPKNVLDLSEVGERATIDEIYSSISGQTGISKSDIDDLLVLSDISDAASEGDPIDVFLVLRNKGNSVGSRFYEMMKRLGYDTVKYLESGAEHYAIERTQESQVSSVSPESSVGAAAYGFDPYTNLQGRYGTIQPGENPARVVDVPSRTEDHNKVSLTARTVMEAAATPDAAVPVIAQMVVDGRFSHIPVSNAQRAEMAENRIQKTGYQDALSNWRADVRAGKSSADITAMGAQLYNAAVNAGRTGEAMDILYDYTQAIRAGAQATQAARILKTLTPSGRLYMLQKEVNNLNDKLSEKQKKAAGKKQSVSAEDNVPVELWMQRVGETLADRLASRVNSPKETARTVAQTVLSDLQRYSNETAPKSLPTGKKRTEMDRIMDLFQNRTAYEEAWQAAKDTISDQFEDNPEALAAFDEWLDSSLDYTKRLTKELTNQDAIVIDESLADAYLSAQTEADRKAAYDQIVQSIANQIPPTFADKWNAWRYMSMLANPRTHIRNIVGNLGFQPVRLAKDEIAALIEGGLSLAGVKMDRTKSFVAAPELYQAAWKDFSNVADSLSGSKYGDVSSEINDRRRIFKAKSLEHVRTGNSNLLELEDVVFKRVTYADALAKFLQANGATAQQLSSGQIDTNLLDRARAYAGQQALKATYQDRNDFSDVISTRFRGRNRVERGLNAAIDAVLPFRRTPANILVRGLEYSPAGLAKSLTVDLAKVKQGKMTAAEAIDNVAAGLTGTGLMALGAYLFMNGMVTGGGGDETQDALDDLTGKQNYALNLPGGGSITLDWLAPEALPFFMGVRMAETLGEDGVTGDDIIASFGAVVDPMLEMSMLQSLNDLIDSVSYVDSTGKVPAMIESALVSYFSQGVPTLFGQIERSFEDKRMTTYTDKGSKIPTDVQYALGRASARIPGQDYQQIPYIDAWGREEESGARPLRIFNNFLNPSYTSTENVTPVDAEAQRLYDALGESARIVVPKRAEKSITVDGETVYLDADQYVEYAKKKGQTAYDVLSAIIQTDAYQNMSDADKVSVFEDVYQYANDIGKMAVSNYKPEGLTAKMLQTGVSADKYMVYYQTADANRDGNITQVESAAALLPVAGLTTQEKGKIWQSQNKDWSTEKNPFTGALANAGISPNLATEIMNRYSEINSAAYSGNSVARQKQTALSKYLDSLKLSEKQRAVVDDTYKFYTMFPAEPIAYSVNTMSDAAQEKWPIVKSYGMSESDYLKYYPIVSSSEKGKTKEMKIRELQEAGLSYNQANTFWNIVKSK